MDPFLAVYQGSYSANDIKNLDAEDLVGVEIEVL
jgi:hypothetical protein